MNVIQMPGRAPEPDLSKVPDYTGRHLCLNPEKGRKFQCGGFFLGPLRPSAVVDEDAQMYQIHRAILDGRLLDITENAAIKTEFSTLDAVGEEMTGKRVYITQDASGVTVVLGVEDPEKQKEFDEQLATSGRIVVPPGYGEEEKYLLNFGQAPVAPEVPKRAGLLERFVGLFRKK